ncbi:Centrosomal protein of 41 kDa (Cep41) (Testis-specific gene A14 protein), partial [Durusdinium trenchii]
VLEKKIPRNPKYANVRGSLDTGHTRRKVKHISTKEFLKRQNELFSRIKARELGEWLEFDPIHEREDGGERLETTSPGSSATVSSSQIALVLDVRELAEFETCHIKTAVSYPLVNINQDRFTADMYRFKNRPGKVIVVYDDDERFSSLAARLLVERGFDNVRLLTGGLKVFGNANGHQLQGQLPEHLIKPAATSPTDSSVSRRELRQRRRALESPRSSQFGSSASSCAYSVAGSTTSSVASHRSTFARAPRWKADPSAVQRHREAVAKLHK